MVLEKENSEYMGLQKERLNKYLQGVITAMMLNGTSKASLFYHND